MVLMYLIIAPSSRAVCSVFVHPLGVLFLALRSSFHCLANPGQQTHLGGFAMLRTRQWTEN